MLQPPVRIGRVGSEPSVAERGAQWRKWSRGVRALAGAVTPTTRGARRMPRLPLSGGRCRPTHASGIHSIRRATWGKEKSHTNRTPSPGVMSSKPSSGVFTSTSGTAAAARKRGHCRDRRQRLLALQQKPAQLKRTPSMQLIARQRLPRLEEAIKHQIAEIQASA